MFWGQPSDFILSAKRFLSARCFGWRQISAARPRTASELSGLDDLKNSRREKTALMERRSPIRRVFKSLQERAGSGDRRSVCLSLTPRL